VLKEMNLGYMLVRLRPMAAEQNLVTAFANKVAVAVVVVDAEWQKHKDVGLVASLIDVQIVQER